MMEIIEGQTLELKHLISFKGKIRNNQLDQIVLEMENEISKYGKKRIGYPITATFGADQNFVDVELLLPIDGEIIGINKYTYKPTLKIFNAVVAVHIGSPLNLQDTCNQLNKYIIQNNLIPVTVGYNVTLKIDPLNIEKTEINVYVGINPNIL